MRHISLLLLALSLLAAALTACGSRDNQDTLPPVDSLSQHSKSVPTLAPGADPTLAPTPTQEPQPAPGAALPPAQQPTPAGAATPAPTQPTSGSATEEPTPTETAPPAAAPEVVGTWRIYSARIFYDEGGGGTVDTTITRELDLAANGTWYFGSSSGAYSITAITSDDWSRWGVEPYGPARKITLSYWNGGTADGPMEESGGRVDFLWVIYHQEPPVVTAPGTVWMKFGH